VTARVSISSSSKAIAILEYFSKVWSKCVFNASQKKRMIDEFMTVKSRRLAAKYKHLDALLGHGYGGRYTM
jgi:hypothetical protein